MKRFWREARPVEHEGEWQVALDGRGVKTQAGQPQRVPSAALARAMAGEWAAQGEQVDPTAFVLRDLADYALDVVAPDRNNAARALLTYAETDTLCYRGDEGDALHARQIDVWEPLLARAEARWDVRFPRVSGVIATPLSAETRERMAAVLEACDPFALAALTMLASLSASLVVALAALEPDADAEALWAAANLEEDWQAELWGRDAEAEAARATRLEAFRQAMRFAALARGE
ncbi:molecular chaperone [Novosphingobium sp. PC22D]|uniref:ATP12 family protein n=1 Tax=Novosphingobium sp. PC22D TaxID=1962403 RepID=UPI000BF0D415|nr:ATP12 family protein [Novosphingobium sp. PC22D]PEQ13937.1 molecular chaperone [Novosphingobium sp. PC22D]